MSSILGQLLQQEEKVVLSRFSTFDRVLFVKEKKN
jgi:hypothetical protein